MMIILMIILILTNPCWVVANPIPIPDTYINEVQISPIPRFEIHREFHRYCNFNGWKIRTTAGTMPIENFTLASGSFKVITDTQVIGNFSLNSISDSLVLLDSLGMIVARVKWPYNFTAPSNNKSAALINPGYYIWYTNQTPSMGYENPGQTFSAVELSEIISNYEGGCIAINWKTESETDNYAWLIERSFETNKGFLRIANIPASMNSTAGASYSYLDQQILPDTGYFYRIGDQNKGGEVTWHGPLYVSTKVQRLESTTSSSLNIKSFPNPANERMLLSLSVPSGVDYSLKIYDISGRLVKDLDRGTGNSGSVNVQWRGDDCKGKTVASGNYLAVLTSNAGKVTHKLIWVK